MTMAISLFRRDEVTDLMNKVDTYICAATRDNTRRSYQSAARHFEVEWAGFLPASADSLARYLADYADPLATRLLARLPQR